MKTGTYIDIFSRKLFWPTVRKHCSSEEKQKCNKVVSPILNSKAGHTSYISENNMCKISSLMIIIFEKRMMVKSKYLVPLNLFSIQHMPTELLLTGKPGQAQPTFLTEGALRIFLKNTNHENRDCTHVIFWDIAGVHSFTTVLFWKFAYIVHRDLNRDDWIRPSVYYRLISE